MINRIFSRLKEVAENDKKEDDETPPAGWRKIDKGDYHNIWGIQPYKTLFEKRIGGLAEGTPPYDLAILKHDDGYYMAAHGGIIGKRKHKTAKDAAKSALDWYNEQIYKVTDKDSLKYFTEGLRKYLESSPSQFTKFGKAWGSRSNKTIISIISDFMKGYEIVNETTTDSTFDRDF